MGAFLKLFLLALLLQTTATTTASTSFVYKLALQCWRPYFPHPLSFTIHGLWHDDTSINRPICKCRPPGIPFNYSLLRNAYASNTSNASLITRLELCWPNVQYKRNNVKFWKGEWRSHGGCSTLPYDQVGYFRLGADLYDRYDISRALTEAGINTGSRRLVLLTTINNTIIRATQNKVPILKCLWDNSTQKQILHEVHLCFNYSFPHDVIDCPLPPRCYNYNICSDTYIFI